MKNHLRNLVLLPYEEDYYIRKRIQTPNKSGKYRRKNQYKTWKKYRKSQYR